MILGFKQEINGKPTHFLEKIWLAFDNDLIITNESKLLFKLALYDRIGNKYGDLSYAELAPKYYPKLHTIRKDENDQWKVGNKIHAVYNHRQKGRQYQFVPTFKCLGTQKIEIKWQIIDISVYPTYRRLYTYCNY